MIFIQSLFSLLPLWLLLPPKLLWGSSHFINYPSVCFTSLSPSHLSSALVPLPCLADPTSPPVPSIWKLRDLRLGPPNVFIWISHCLLKQTVYNETLPPNTPPPKHYPSRSYQPYPEHYWSFLWIQSLTLLCLNEHECEKHFIKKKIFLIFPSFSGHCPLRLVFRFCWLPLPLHI